MKKNSMDGKFIEFPLCFLIYAGGKPKKLLDILSYYFVECAYKLDKDIDLDKRISEVMKEYKVRIDNQKYVIDKYMLLSSLFSYRIDDSGKEPYCSIGKDVFYETMDGKFKYEHFAFLCGLSAVLGKVVAYKKITRERLGYAMIGYKSRDNYLKEEKGNLKPLNDKAIERIANLLQNKKFFVKFTFHRKQSYYSTRLDSMEKLAELIMASKLKKQEMLLKTKHIELSNMIDKRLQEQRENHNKIYRLSRKDKGSADVRYMSS